MGRIIGVNSLPKTSIIGVLISNSTPTKKGNKEGKTVPAQSAIPFEAAAIFPFENKIKQIKKMQNKQGKIKSFILIETIFFKIIT